MGACFGEVLMCSLNRAHTIYMNLRVGLSLITDPKRCHHSRPRRHHQHLHWKPTCAPAGAKREPKWGRPARFQNHSHPALELRESAAFVDWPSSSAMHRFPPHPPQPLRRMCMCPTAVKCFRAARADSQKVERASCPTQIWRDHSRSSHVVSPNAGGGQRGGYVTDLRWLGSAGAASPVQTGTAQRTDHLQSQQKATPTPCLLCCCKPEVPKVPCLRTRNVCRQSVISRGSAKKRADHLFQ